MPGIKMLERQSVEHDKGGQLLNSERMNSTKLNTQHEDFIHMKYKQLTLELD